MGAVPPSPASASAVPGVPAGVSATVTSSGSVSITWQAVSGATSYVVSNGNTSTPNLTTTSYAWGVLAPGTYMCFTVTAKNSAGQSAWSPYSCVTSPLPTPTNVSATPLDSTIVKIEWSYPSSLYAGFTVSNGDESRDTVATGSTSYLWTGLTPNTYMCFTVEANVNNGQSPWSAYACTTTATPPDTYVALGDSFTAGEGTYGPYLDGTDTAFNKCHRSPKSYPAQYVAQSSRYPAVRNVACSGAVTDDITTAPGPINSMGVPSSGEAPQIVALGNKTKLVTLTIGGNDLDLAGIFTNCYSQFVQPAIDDCFSSKFSDSFINTTIPTILDGDRYKDQYGNWNQHLSLDATYTKIREAAPNATVVVLTYAQVFPKTWQSRQLCGTVPETMVSQPVLDRIRRVITALNTKIKATAAAEPGIQLVDEENALAGHEVCTRGTAQVPGSWVNPLNALGQDDEDLHPTSAGYANEAYILHQYFGATA